MSKNAAAAATQTTRSSEGAHFTGASAARELYARANDPESSFPGGVFTDRLHVELTRFTGVEPPADPAEAVAAVAEWSAGESAAFADLAAAPGHPGTREALVRRAALACAPLALRSGAWLQWLSAPGNADDADVLAVLALYASDLGVGQPRASRGSAYLALLRRLHLSENAEPVARLTHDQRVPDQHFVVPALLLAMSRRPDDFRQEILGADLCLRAVGLLPALTAVRAAHPDAVDWSALDPATARTAGEPSGLDRALAIVSDVDGSANRARARAGFRWAFAALSRWSGALRDELGEARDPAYEMAELLRLRAREGAVYHQNFTIAGKSLSQWLEDSRTDPSGLLDELARSRLVKPGRSGASSLVNGLVSERGPMFRVFSPSDLTIIRRWIDSLPQEGAEAVVPAPRRQVDSVSSDLPAAAVQPDDDAAELSVREAYHLLMRRTDTPALRRFAIDYVHGWLARSRYGMDDDPQRLPDTWGAEGLRPWLVEQHDQHGKAFEAGSDTPLPTREELIEATVQTAPLTLIDGAWLQGFTDYEHAASEQGYFLFETYWDELGNGEARLNHPLIYRQVLAEMDVTLPPTASREFAHWPRFRDESFELPVYWLCVGRFPRTFLPEILGLNLAMELSGVGGSYRRSRLALREHGFSTRFVDIHNTIDNVATGHSAWAADAVDTYLAALPASHGAAAVTEAWERVRVGFRSLNPPSSFLARRAFRRARKSSRT